MKKDFQKLLETAKENGLRLTPQRVRLLELIASVKGHFCAEEIHELSKKKNAGISLATIYRNLDTLTRLGVIKREDFGDGRARFEVFPSKHHHHLVCLKCGFIEEINDPMIDEFEQKLEKKSKFKIADHRLEFFGYCPSCRRQASGGR